MCSGATTGAEGRPGAEGGAREDVEGPPEGGWAGLEESWGPRGAGLVRGRHRGEDEFSG